MLLKPCLLIVENTQYHCRTYLHGRDLARNREIHKLVADLDRQSSHESRVHLRLEDDRLVRAHLDGNKKKTTRARASHGGSNSARFCAKLCAGQGWAHTGRRDVVYSARCLFIRPRHWDLAASVAKLRN